MITLTSEELKRVRNPEIALVQKFINVYGGQTALVVDGIWGSLSKSTFILAFVNKNAEAISYAEKLEIAKQLGDTNTKRLEAVAKVESGPDGGWFPSGLPTILFERHKFWQWIGDKSKRVVSWFSNPTPGGYTKDANKNGINDSWEKLADAIGSDPKAALKSISIGEFQVMGVYHLQCGYEHPIEMLWAARNSQRAQYMMLRDYILKVANLKPAFLKLSTNPADCEAFARGYNGGSYKKYDYHNKLAKAMR